MEAFILAALVGILVGVCSGLLGIGGGTLMVPIFRLGFGMSALASTATSLFTIIPTSLVGCITHIRNKTCIPRIGLLCGIAGACTSPLGVWLASMSPSWLVMLVAGIIIVYSSYNMFRKAARLPKASAVRSESKTSSLQSDKSNPSVSSEGQHEIVESESPVLDVKKTLLALGIGLFAGLCSGYVGVGGGFIMVPLFVALLGIMMRQASGTSLIAVTILAIPGAITQGMLGNIDYVVGIAMAVGSIPGAALGASLVRKVPERQLRFLFGAFLLVAAIVLVIEECTPFLG